MCYKRPGVASRTILSHANRLVSSTRPMHGNSTTRIQSCERLRKVQSSQGRGAGQPVALGIGDDAALFRPKPGARDRSNLRLVPGGHALLAREDRRMRGWSASPGEISDVAAMGGAPRCFCSVWPCQRRTPAGGSICSLRLAARCSQVSVCAGRRRHDTADEILINITVVAKCEPGAPCCDRELAQATSFMSVGGWGKRNWVCRSCAEPKEQRARTTR